MTLLMKGVSLMTVTEISITGMKKKKFFSDDVAFNDDDKEENVKCYNYNDEKENYADDEN